MGTAYMRPDMTPNGTRHPETAAATDWLRGASADPAASLVDELALLVRLYVDSFPSIRHGDDGDDHRAAAS